MRLRFIALVLLLMLATATIGLFATSGQSTAGGAAVPTKVVQFTIAGKGFKPNTITINRNTSITFVNVDIGNDHTVTKTSGPGPSFSHLIPVGKNKIKKFTAAGTYKYVCSFHSNMSGTVVVR